jgi:hypothetical protein
MYHSYAIEWRGRTPEDVHLCRRSQFSKMEASWPARNINCEFFEPPQVLGHSRGKHSKRGTVAAIYVP